MNMYYVNVLLTDSMELRLPCYTNRNSATEGIFEDFIEPEFHHLIQKSPALVSVLCQINLVHTTPCYSSEIHFNIILSPTSVSPY
jgi:hypothetical protein